MMEKWVTIKSQGEKEAREKAVKKFKSSLGTGVEPEELIIREEKTKLIDRIKGLKVFRVGIPGETQGDIELNLDGYFRFAFASDGVFLKVFPSKGKGKSVKIQEIKEEAEKLQLQDVDWEKVEEDLQRIIQENTENRLFIAERKPELDRDAEVEINVAKDGLKAQLDYSPPIGGEYLSGEKLEEKLEAAGIVFGIIEEKFEEIIKSKVPLKGVVIAQGSPSVPGEDGYLEFHFKNKNDGSRGKVREDGSVDFFNLDLIHNVKKGEPLVTVKPPTPGKPGKKVTGEEIRPSEPKEAKIPAGKNIEPDDEGKTLLAGIDGQAVQDRNGKVSVLPVHHVHGDVDLSTGNINFLGTVIVDGNVTEGFRVEAKGDIEVNGNVSAATLKSGGSVKISKGYLGKNKNSIECEGNLEVKFIENGKVKAGGDIAVEEAILHSDITASGKVVVKGKGLIAGGQVQAGQEVEANVLGSSLATKTEISVGVAPEIRENLEEKLKKLDELTDKLNKVEKAIRLLEKQKEKGVIGEERLAQLKKLVETWEQLKDQVEKLQEEIGEIQETINFSEDGEIKVHKALFPGVSIRIAGAQHKVKDRRSRTRLVCSRKEIAYTTF